MARKRDAKTPEPVPLPPIWSNPLPLIVWTDTFSRDWKSSGMTPDDEMRLGKEVVEAGDDPSTRTDVPKLHKIRFAAGRDSRGKSGSYRVCYAAFTEHGTIVLITMFGKNEKSNLTAAEKKGVSDFIKTVEAQLHGEKP